MGQESVVKIHELFEIENGRCRRLRLMSGRRAVRSAGSAASAGLGPWLGSMAGSLALACCVLSTDVRQAQPRPRAKGSEPLGRQGGGEGRGGNRKGAKHPDRETEGSVQVQHQLQVVGGPANAGTRRATAFVYLEAAVMPAWQGCEL